MGLLKNEFSLRRHSGESPPAWMQVVEPRLERAAEESGNALAGYLGAFCLFPVCATITTQAHLGLLPS